MEGSEQMSPYASLAWLRVMSPTWSQVIPK